MRMPALALSYRSMMLPRLSWLRTGRYSRVLGLAAIIALSGCATTPSAVSVSCVREAPEKPQTTDEADILKMDEYQATIVTWTERLLLKAYSEKAEAIITVCR